MYLGFSFLSIFLWWIITRFSRVILIITLALTTLYFRLNLHFPFSGLKMELNYCGCAHENEVRLGLLFSIHASSESYMRGVDFLRYNSTHHTQPIRKMIFACVCWECLTFPQRAGFTQRLCHTSTILLIAGQRLLSGRQGLILDLCVIKQLFEKKSHGIFESNKHTPFRKSVHSQIYYWRLPFWNWKICNLSAFSKCTVNEIERTGGLAAFTS